MKAYEVIAETLTEDGMFNGYEILHRYSNKESAEKHKKAWEALWKKHSNAHKGVSPCWMDYKGTLVIKEITIDDIFIFKDIHNKLTDFESSLKHIMEEAIECGDTHNLKADADMLLRLALNSTEWSEEDEDMRYKATAVINRLCAEGKEYVWSINTLKKLFYWLKSLRPQSQWKPSDEQMEALRVAKAYPSSERREILETLYEELEQLKKLREE